VIRDPVPGPFFIYFEAGSAELGAPQLEFLRTIPSQWNDGDGALVVCSPPFPTDPARARARGQQLDRLKAEFAALGLRRLFLASGDCPALGRKVPEGFTVFVLYGVVSF